MAFWLEDGRVRKKALTLIEWFKVSRPKVLAYDDQIGRLAAGRIGLAEGSGQYYFSSNRTFDLGIPGCSFGAFGVGTGAAWEMGRAEEAIRARIRTGLDLLTCLPACLRDC
jgi:hypothetical protein